MTEATDTNTSDDTNTDGNSRRRYDHDAIRADLAADLSVKDICDKHGCSATIVHRIKNGVTGGERTPRNEQRAVGLRKKVDSLGKELELLTKWKENEPKLDANADGTKPTPVTDLIALLTEAGDMLGTCADLFEALPEAVMKTKRTPTKVTFEVGMVVQAKEKYRDTYKAICSSPDHLTVKGFRDTHVAVEDDQGACFFVPAKELQVRKDA